MLGSGKLTGIENSLPGKALANHRVACEVKGSPSKDDE